MENEKNTPTNRGYTYKLHIKRVQVKIKYPKLLKVYVNLDLAIIYIKLFVITNNAFFFGGIYIYIYTHGFLDRFTLYTVY